MPVKPLNLDDRTFSDLVGEARLLIPRYARPWTDHNTSDPGIMLIELFAWLTEALLYRINRVPDPSRMRLLELLGASFRPAEPAVLELRVAWHGAGDRYELPIGARVRADGGSAKPVFFEVLHEVEFTSLQPVRTVTARQTVRIESKELPQVSSGSPLQLFPLNDGFFTAPPRRRQRRPQVLVAGKPWEYKPFLRESKETDTHFTFKPWLESIAFGDGQKGAIPPAGAHIEVLYHTTPTKPGVVKEQFQSGGQPWQTYRLSQPLPLIDLEEPSDLEPRLQVDEPNTPVLSAPWEFVAGFLDMAENAPQYVVEPWHNAIRFGNGTHGRVPTTGAKIKIAYHQTLGAAGNIPPTSKFSFWSSPTAEMDANEKSWTRVENLETVAWEILSPGRDATSLDDARNQVYALLEPGWRAVTDGDFVSVVQQNHPDIARVVCLPGHDPANPDPAADRPGHVGVIVIPRPTHELTVSATELHPVPGLSADDLRLITGDANGATALWNLKTEKMITSFADQLLHRLVFGPDGLRAVVIAQDGAASLWDTRRGRELVALKSSALLDSEADAGRKSETYTQESSGQPSLSHAVFSPDGRRLATVATDDTAILWESNDGRLLTELGVVDPATPPVFNPDGQLLATAHRDHMVALWRVEEDRPLVKLQLDALATQMLFSPDGARLAIATTNANVRLGHIRPAHGAVLEELTLNPGYLVKALIFDPSGMRLATRGQDGDAVLWSSRTGARMAELSHQGSVDQLAFSGDGRWLATAHRDHTVRCWNARNGREVFALSNTLTVHAMVFSPTGHRLVVVGAPAQQTPILEAWDLRGVSAERVATQPLSGSQPVVLNESGQWLAYTDERLVHVWDVEKSKDITAFYVDFDDPGIQGDGWSLVTSHDDANSAPAAQVAPVRVTRGPYLWVVSAAGAGTAVKRAVQVLDAEHVYRVDTLLGKRKLVTSQHHVEGPTYKEVGVSVTVTRRTLVKSQQSVTADISNALSRFFDPLHGGPEGTGWPLGRSVHASEVFEVVEGVAAVDHVEHLTLKIDGSEQKDRIDIPPQNLVNCHIQVE